METRKQALKWWREMSIDEQEAIVEKYHKEGPFIAIATSSSKVERMFIKEQDGKETT